MRFDVIDPASGTRIETVDGHSASDVDARLSQARRAFLAWREWPPSERAGKLRTMAELLRSRAGRYADRMAREMGKPVTQGIAEAEKCAWVCDFYADYGPSWLESENVLTDAARSYVRFEPLGVILAIMPWNFPFWQVFRFAAPAIMAGNAIVVKHAGSTPGCAVDIEQLARDAGLPDGLVTALLVDHDAVDGLLADPRVAAVTLTGSERAGTSVAASAGRNVKKAVLELGGSDPFVVLADADLDRAAQVGARARLQNAGQSCIAAKRFIVVEAVAEAFVARFKDHLARAKLGSPADPATEVGPLARADLRDALHRQVLGSVRLGARLALGGRVPDGPGFYYPPTLLLDVRPGMPAWDEEVFGPVAAVRVVADVDAALAAANQTEFGLGAAVFTGSARAADRFAADLEAGCVFVNGMVRSDPRLPFGGVKKSGYGRELSRFGLHEFVNIKTVWMG